MDPVTHLLSARHQSNQDIYHLEVFFISVVILDKDYVALL